MRHIHTNPERKSQGRNRRRLEDNNKINSKDTDYWELKWIPMVGGAFQWLDLYKYCIVMGLHTRRENISISGCSEESVRLCYVGESQFISFPPTRHYTCIHLGTQDLFRVV